RSTSGLTCRLVSHHMLNALERSSAVRANPANFQRAHGEAMQDRSLLSAGARGAPYRTGSHLGARWRHTHSSASWWIPTARDAARAMVGAMARGYTISKRSLIATLVGSASACGIFEGHSCTEVV